MWQEEEEMMEMMDGAKDVTGSCWAAVFHTQGLLVYNFLIIRLLHYYFHLWCDSVTSYTDKHFQGKRKQAPR